MKFAALLTCLPLVLPTGSLNAADPPVGEPHVYKKADGRDLRLWMVEPKVAAASKRPAIVFFHGGGWTQGGPGAFNGQAEYLASRGMVGVLVEYRLLPDKSSPPTVCIQDAQSAMRWVRAHAAEFGVDPERIAAAGGSAGGHLAAFLALMRGFDDPRDDVAVSPKPQAMVLFNPVLDNGPHGWGYKRVGERFREYSPFHHVAAGAPPAVVFLGTEDHLVPVKTVKDFQAAMRRAGARCDAHFYGGEGHGFFNLKRKGGLPGKYYATLIETDRFLASLGWLQGEPTLVIPESPPDKGAHP